MNRASTMNSCGRGHLGLLLFASFVAGMSVERLMFLLKILEGEPPGAGAEFAPDIRLNATPNLSESSYRMVQTGDTDLYNAMQAVRCIEANVSTCAFREVDFPGSSSWLRLYRRLSRGGTVRVLVLGGSMTAGVECVKDGTVPVKACAWSGRFVKWLRAEFPEAKISFENRARAGTQTEVALGGITAMLKSEEAWDIIFTDYSVNDFIHSAVITKFGGGSPEDRLSMLNEKLILTIKALAPIALHVNIIASCPTCLSRLSLQKAVSVTYEKHGVSLVDLSRRCFGPGKTLFLCNWDHAAHPNAAIHQDFADAVSSHFKLSFSFSKSGTLKPSGEKDAQDVNRSLWSKETLDRFPVCLQPLVSFDAYLQWKIQKEDVASPARTSSWNLTEDRPGKPGWIATQNGTKLTFPLIFGSSPMMSVTFLRSYEGLGDAEIFLNGKIWKLTGLWDDPVRERISVSETVVFQVSRTHSYGTVMDLKYGVAAFGVKPFQKLPVEFTFRSQNNHSKFKIISVLSC